MSKKEKHAEYMREYNAMRRENGICAHCGKPLTDPSSPLHLECKELKNEQRRQRRKARNDSGKCTECGCSLDGSSSRRHCTVCAAEHKKRSSDRVKRLRDAQMCISCAKEPSAGETQHCTTCTVKGLASKILKDRSRWVDLKNLLDSQNGLCVYSGVPITIGVDASIDHIAAKDNGGTDDIENLQWVHYVVNMMKWNTPEDLFLEYARKIASHCPR